MRSIIKIEKGKPTLLFLDRRTRFTSLQCNELNRCFAKKTCEYELARERERETETETMIIGIMCFLKKNYDLLTKGLKV
jgi:hypothetical protein